MQLGKPVPRKLWRSVIQLRNFLNSKGKNHQDPQICEELKPSKEIENETDSSPTHKKYPLNAPSFQDLKDTVKRQEEEIRHLRDVIKMYDETLYRLSCEIKLAEENISSCIGSFYCNAYEKMKKQNELLKNARKMVSDFQEEMKNKIFHPRIRTVDASRIELYLLLILLVLFFRDSKE